MAPHDIDAAVWERICESYRLPADADVRALPGASTSKYSIASPAARFTLHLNRPLTRAGRSIAPKLALVARLAATTSIPMAAPIPNRDGELLTVIGHGTVDLGAVLYSWIPGEPVGEHLSSALMQLVGETLGQLGLGLKGAGSGINEPRFHRRDWVLGWPYTRLAEAPTWSTVAGELAPRLRGNIKALKPFLPHQLIHRDAHFGNLVFDGSRLGVVDFERLSYHPRVFELAPPLANLWESERAGLSLTGTWSELRESVIGGYDSRAAISDLERRALPLLEAVHLFVWLGWAVEQDPTWLADFGPSGVCRIRMLLDSYERTGRTSRSAIMRSLGARNGSTFLLRQGTALPTKLAGTIKYATARLKS